MRLIQVCKRVGQRCCMLSEVVLRRWVHARCLARLYQYLSEMLRFWHVTAGWAHPTSHMKAISGHHFGMSNG